MPSVLKAWRRTHYMQQKKSSFAFRPYMIELFVAQLTEKCNQDTTG